MILGVNIDHVATLRQARLAGEPDPVMGATLAVLGGADGITLHLREDRRHVNDRDLQMLKGFVPVELNMEMAATAEMVRIALRVKPTMVTLVPEKRQELTTEGGLELKRNGAKIRKAIKRLNAGGMPVSLFINPTAGDVEMSAELGADMVEIHTGLYANAKGKRKLRELRRVEGAVEAALGTELLVNAGHGLDYFNVKGVAAIPGLRGLYIGHSIISRAVLVGLERAVGEMKGLMLEAAPL